MIYCLGSINADLFYRMPHLPAPGETLAALSHTRGLGGKGANQSVAAARAGAKVAHLGAVGTDGGWMVERLEALGVGCSGVARVGTASGHAIIAVDGDGENAIILYPGANRAIPGDVVSDALRDAGPADALILQNETSHQVEAARFGQEQGLFVAYSAAPFEAEAARAVLPYLSLLLLNEIEAAQLCAALGVDLRDLPVPAVCVTRGKAGASYYDLRAGTAVAAPVFRVEAVDTTGAGDTFAGYLVAGLVEGLPVADALRLASGAAALKVTRPGTADAIPPRAEVEAFLADQPSA